MKRNKKNNNKPRTIASKEKKIPRTMMNNTLGHHIIF
jgi:hypothetical protein